MCVLSTSNGWPSVETSNRFRPAPSRRLEYADRVSQSPRYESPCDWNLHTGFFFGTTPVAIACAADMSSDPRREEGLERRKDSKGARRRKGRHAEKEREVWNQILGNRLSF